MNPERWERLGQLLPEALALSGAARAEFVERSTAGDAELRAELESLLEASTGADEYLSHLRYDVLGADPHGAIEDVLQGGVTPDRWLGRTIGHYRIVDRLGGGGMGVVYRADDGRLNRRVALKFIAPEIGRDPEAKRRFLQEARTAASLDHPNICTIHEIGETPDGRLFMVMALYEGETLRKRLARGPVTPEEALDLGTQVASALEAAHARGIVHRDVKPANVLITEDGVVKLLDFGLARTAEDPSRTGSTRGTVAYMSPEQARGSQADERSDVWAVGVMLYEMLLGERPFAAPHPQAAIRRILEDEPERLDELERRSPEIAAVVRAALAKDPALRIGDGGLLRVALAEGGPAGPARPPAPSRSRDRSVRLAVIVGVLLLVVAAVTARRLSTDAGPASATDAGAAAEPAAAAAEPAAAASLASPTSRLLWIDDNPENNLSMARRLRVAGVEVETALSTAEAVERYAPDAFQLVVSDMGRYEGPDGAYEARAGFHLLERLRQVDPDAPVAFCTSPRAVAAHREEALARGALVISATCEEIFTLVGP